ncbi:MAG: amidase, partial [Mesorhizobium sp.]
PLHGVPFTLKDTHDTAGMKTTVGFPPFADYVAKKDSPVVARLKAAGAILIGKTNVATMLSDWQSDNPLFGRTGNPWNLSRTAGGSSGGAAAAVATGMTPFEVGTDMQDSIRLPSGFCGVYGLKPTEHRVSLAGAFPDPGGTVRS